MMSLNVKIAGKIVNYFAKEPGVAAVYLYGSQARGDAKAASDIDLAVLVTDAEKNTRVLTSPTSYLLKISPLSLVRK